MSPVLLPLGLLPDFGGGEMLLVVFVVLLLFGGDKMPQLAKSIGKSLREFKKAANEVEREIKRAIDEVPDTPSLQDAFRKAIENKPKTLPPAPAPAPPTPIVAENLPSVGEPPSPPPAPPTS